jgi:hypothetical protein
MSYIYLKSEPTVYTVGCFRPPLNEREQARVVFDSGLCWDAESDHISADDAAARVHYLNGGSDEGHMKLAKEYRTVMVELFRRDSRGRWFFATDPEGSDLTDRFLPLLSKEGYLK